MQFDRDSCDTHPDALFCAAARHNEFDSIIVRRDLIKFGHVSGSHSDVIELILCPTVEAPEQLLACPPSVEHRLAGGLSSCTCNATGELLARKENGHAGSYAMVGDYGTRPVAVIGLASAVFISGPLAVGVGVLALWRRVRGRTVARPAAVALSSDSGGPVRG